MSLNLLTIFWELFSHLLWGLRKHPHIISLSSTQSHPQYHAGWVNLLGGLIHVWDNWSCQILLVLPILSQASTQKLLRTHKRWTASKKSEQKGKRKWTNNKYVWVQNGLVSRSCLALSLDVVFAWTDLSIVSKQMAVSKHFNSLLLSYFLCSSFFTARCSNLFAMIWFSF